MNALNHNVPKGVQEILDDPIEDGNGTHSHFVTIVQCLGVQKLLEHRLTKMETQAKLMNVQSLSILIGVVLALLKLFFGL